MKIICLFRILASMSGLSKKSSLKDDEKNIIFISVIKDLHIHIKQ